MRPIIIVILLLLTLPVSAAGQSGGDGELVIVVRPEGNKMLFETTTISAPAGSRVTIVMENTASDPAMQHNVAVLDAAPDDEAVIRAVGMAALEAGDAAGFIPEHEALIAATPMAAPGERTEVTFDVPPAGDYAFVCLFPGHFMTMRGTLRVTP